MDEYYIYDPDSNELTGLQRSDKSLQLISDMNGWVSPLLEIQFRLLADDLEIYRPDGEKFLTFIELGNQLSAEKKRVELLEAKLREMGVDPESFVE